MSSKKYLLRDIARTTPWLLISISLLMLGGLYSWARAHRAAAGGYGAWGGGGGPVVGFVFNDGKVEICDVDGDLGPSSPKEADDLRFVSVSLFVQTSPPFHDSSIPTLVSLGDRLPTVRTDYRLRLDCGGCALQELSAIRDALADYAEEQNFGRDGAWSTPFPPQIGELPATIDFSDAIRKAWQWPPGVTIPITNLPSSWIVETVWHWRGIAASVVLVLAPLLALGVVAQIARVWIRRFRALARQNLRACRACGYSIEGLLSHVCPECGAALAAEATT